MSVSVPEGRQRHRVRVRCLCYIVLVVALKPPPNRAESGLGEKKATGYSFLAKLKLVENF